MEFKDRIKLLRETKGLDLTKLAAQFNMKEAGVRAWELGRTKPGADTLIALAKYFDCTTDYLLGLSSGKKPNIAAIVDNLGLSQTAIKKLIDIQKSIDEQSAVYYEQMNNTISMLISDKEGYALWHTITKYLHLDIPHVYYALSENGKLEEWNKCESIKEVEIDKYIHKGMDKLSYSLNDDTVFVLGQIIEEALFRDIEIYLEGLRFKDKKY